MSILTSPVTWALAGSFVFGGLNEILSVVPAGWASGVSAIIFILGTILHRKQIVAGRIGKISG